MGKLMDFFNKLGKGVEQPMSKSKAARKAQKGSEINFSAGSVSDADKQAEALSKWPPRIMLHSFSGSLEIVRSILRLPQPISSRFYFSFSTGVNGRNADKTYERIRAIPDDRVLIESDLHDVG
ncbi:hypothetical protein HK101_005297, partial [Irineochytrium annulatum]